MDERHHAAAGLLDAFADDTGLASDEPERRYLWTDAFAVGTWLGLHRTSGEGRFLELARTLVDRVHRVLGRHRADDPREGWISGLGEDEGARHPTAGGLRIGKPLPERDPDEPPDPALEWERDGQYYHYLTRWMHALDQASRATGEPRYQRQAAELARAAHRGFAHRAAGRARLYWKVSVDLSRPLVPSMGHHDPLDGLVATASVEASPVRDAHAPPLDAEIAELERMCEGRSWITDDPLGLGGLLLAAFRLAGLVEGGREELRPLLERLVTDARESLEVFARRVPLDAPAERRLAFRELGLALGLRSARRLERRLGEGGLEPRGALAGGVADLARAEPLAEGLEAFWSDARNQAVPTWAGHRDINAVTLAAALAPEGWLGV